mmetsp:Transcript_12259/g.33719  ORF Transcript_12259/g.33719 Transcript_12259/m.33719 type:complete len:87 (+) Transcript_12259:108-368(+)
MHRSCPIAPTDCLRLGPSFQHEYDCYEQYFSFVRFWQRYLCTSNHGKWRTRSRNERRDELRSHNHSNGKVSGGNSFRGRGENSSCG